MDKQEAPDPLSPEPAGGIQQATPGPGPGGGTGHAWIAISLGLFVILAGLVQSGLDEEFFPRCHFPLLQVAFGIPPVVLGLVAFHAHGRGGRTHFLLRHVGKVSVIFLACALGTQSLLERVGREEHFDMNWSPAPYKLGAKDRTKVLLEFADHPGWTTDIESKELADYLSTLGSRRVPVVIWVVRDFGRLREFRVTQVADRRAWSYNDCSGFMESFGWKTAPTAAGDAVGPPPIR